MNWKRIAVASTIGTLGALNAPVLPVTEEALYWYEPTPGAEVCYQVYQNGTEKPFECEDYWIISKTPNHPQPERTMLVSPLASMSVEAAIAFDLATTNAAQASSLSFSHTVSGSDRGLIIHAVNSTNQSCATSQRVTSATYNGVAATFEVRNCQSDAGEDSMTEIFSLVNPATGSNTVSITWGVSAAVIGAASSYTGVDQTDFTEATASAIGTNDLPTVNITTLTANAWVVDGVSHDEDENATVGAGQTERWDVLSSASGDNGAAYGSTEGPVASPGSVTMSWTIASGGDDWAIAAVAIKPAAEGGGTPAAAKRHDVIFFD